MLLSYDNVLVIFLTAVTKYLTNKYHTEGGLILALACILVKKTWQREKRPAGACGEASRGFWAWKARKAAVEAGLGYIIKDPHTETHLQPGPTFCGLSFQK